MKSINLLLITLIFSFTNLFSQIKVNQITYRNQEHFISTEIDYPVAGTYLFEGKSEPIVVLNENGTGIFQYQDLTKKDISWGIECLSDGIPVFKEGFNSASYSLYYKTNENEEWILIQFSIHYNNKKMFIMGERVKDYVDNKEFN